MINKEFKLVCPNCGASEKVMAKCRVCKEPCCSECSFDNVCIDCYADIYTKREIDIYVEERQMLRVTQ